MGMADIRRRCSTMWAVRSASAKPSSGEAVASQRMARPERKEKRRRSVNCARRVRRVKGPPRGCGGGRKRVGGPGKKEDGGGIGDWGGGVGRAQGPAEEVGGGVEGDGGGWA